MTFWGGLFPLIQDVSNHIHIIIYKASTPEGVIVMWYSFLEITLGSLKLSIKSLVDSTGNIPLQKQRFGFTWTCYCGCKLAHTSHKKWITKRTIRCHQEMKVVTSYLPKWASTWDPTWWQCYHARCHKLAHWAHYNDNWHQQHTHTHTHTHKQKRVSESLQMKARCWISTKSTLDSFNTKYCSVASSTCWSSRYWYIYVPIPICPQSCPSTYLSLCPHLCP